MTELPCVPGFFGKLPMRGDFVARRLPPQFVRVWDAWLQQALAKSQEQLDGQWIDIYLSSPLWRFSISSGICGENGWIGVLMPSVDQAGRYFPLTVAVPVTEPDRIDYLFLAAVAWFEQVEDLLLTVLDDAADLDIFDCNLQLLLPTFMTASADLPDRNSHQSPKNTIQTQLKQWLSDNYRPGCTIWSSSGSELVEPAFFLLEGLPDSALLLLTGPVAKAGQPVLDNLNSLNICDLPGLSAFFTQGDLKIGNSELWQSCALSDVGKVRKINEDAFLERSDIGLWVVADGMGGHHAGDVASQTAIVSLNDIAFPDGGVYNDLPALITEVVDRLQYANDKLVAMAQGLSPDTVIGSTVVAMLAVGDQCAAVWSGDSRLYQFRAGVLCQLTRDHSLVNEMIRNGQGSREELANSQISNVVTQALGAEAELNAETVLFTAQKNDLYLLCSDGLTGEVSESEISCLLAGAEFNDIPRLLIDSALSRMARDNITVVVVRWI